MPSKVTLNITQGPARGQKHEFEEHDTLILGRMPDCKICFPDDDLTLSRHHFLLELTPPKACLRDLGSKNGTYVNGKKYGGRAKDETPEQGAQHSYPQVELKDGDEVCAGETHIQVLIQAPWYCYMCGKELEAIDLEEGQINTGSYLCHTCAHKGVGTVEDIPTPQPVICLNCGLDVSAEASPTVTGGYLCQKCRQLAQDQVVDPMEMLKAMLKEAQLEQSGDLNIPDYEVLKKLGQGGMGAVYLVKHKRDGKKAALKIMLPRAEVNVKARVKFVREIELMRTLTHPNIVEFYQHGEVGGIDYFLMEFCPGGCAADLAKEHGGRLDLPDATRIMLQALKGLAFAHKAGVIHRDLKPQNILLTSRDANGIAKVADMGLAKNYLQAGYSGVTGKESMGTVPFMPREQVSDFKFCKPVSDVWAMGATFYNLLSGRYPRQMKPGQDPFVGVLQNEVIPIRTVLPSLPVSVAEVIGKALQESINYRFQDAEEFRAALEQAANR